MNKKLMDGQMIRIDDVYQLEDFDPYTTVLIHRDGRKDMVRMPRRDIEKLIEDNKE